MLKVIAIIKNENKSRNITKGNMPKVTSSIKQLTGSMMHPKGYELQRKSSPLGGCLYEPNNV